jgi:hypothetical protein
LQKFAASLLELQDATDPLLGCKWPRFQRLIIAMETAAPIAQ